MNTEKKIAKKRYSFLKAYGMIPISEAKIVKRELMNVLGMKAVGSWRNALSKGYISPTVDKYAGVVRVFKKYGITDCWEEVVEQ